MTPPYRLAALSYDKKIENMLHELPRSDTYTIDYFPLQYGKPCMGVREVLNDGYEACLIYSSFAGFIMRDECINIVDINKSDMDRVRALLKARECTREIGLPLQRSERVDCGLLEKLCDVTLHRILYDDPGGIKKGVHAAVKRGVKVFVGGGMTMSACTQYGALCVPVLPNPENLSDAIARAMNIARLTRKEKSKHEQLASVFKLFNDGALHINAEGECTFFNLNALSLLGIHESGGVPERVRGKIKQFYDELFVDDALRDNRPYVDQLVVINGRELVVNTLPIIGHAGSHSVAVFLRDVEAVHDMAGKLRSIQKQKGGFKAICTVEHIQGVSTLVGTLRERVRQYAPHSAPVLIHGETGSGKDLVAQALHNAGLRRDGPFVAINCAALPESLLESELFGYEEGAFTGARKGGKPGLFELAHTGTIFLDEIGELSPTGQSRLLRVLENKEIIRVGGSRVIPVDIRVISASHKSLPELAHKKQFRADLFYRLAVLRLEIPPLRMRLEDIPSLLESTLRQYGRDRSCLTPGILDDMAHYHWPGNIRELRAVMESYLIMLGTAPYDDELFHNIFSTWTRDFQYTGMEHYTFNAGKNLKSMLDDIRRRIVKDVVARCASNRKKAAEQLGISYNTIWRILGEDRDASSQDFE